MLNYYEYIFFNLIKSTETVAVIQRVFYVRIASAKVSIVNTNTK